MSDDTPRPREKASDITGPPPEVTGQAQRRRRRRSSPGRSAGAGAGASTGENASENPGSGAEVARPPAERKPTQRRRAPRKPASEGNREAKTGEPKGTNGDEEPRPGERSGSRRGRGSRRRPQRRERPSIERTMLVHAHERGTQIAVIERDQIVEHYVADARSRSIVGNVYLGRVQNVLPGMEASFVDVGESRNGVLYASEVGIAGDEADNVPRIETVLKAGQPILVQVTKDPMRSKGARLTALVSIAGRHLVLVPGAGSIGVSRRLPDKERNRLRDLAQKLKPQDHGLIVRTAAEGAQETDVQRDLERLLETWNEIKTKAEGAKAPALIYEEPELELRVIRDLFNREITKCIVDDAELESKLRSYVRQTTPDLDHRLELYEGALPIFEEFRVSEQIRKSLDRRVWLPAGGHLVVDRTEAMTVIDVNTGKFVGKSNLEETVFRTNKEAAVEVARQLRLRDIGGIIVIDFIDMENLQNRDETINLFRKELDRDRTRTQVFDISPLGLVQMTRKNVSAGIVETFSDPCPHCEGRGIVVHDID